MNCIKLDSKNKKTIITRVKIPVRENDSEVVVKVAFAGICGTDLHIVEVNIFWIFSCSFSA